jgi:arylsulfatase A-like enzyme
MTGLHTGHARVRDNSAPGIGRVPLRAEDVTVAELLQRAGYRTGLIGKWGLGEAGTGGIPTRKGFDEFFGFLNQDHALHYYPLHLWNNETEFFPKGNQGAKRNDYVQDLFTARAFRFVESHRNEPFFLYLAYTVPHADSERSRDTGDGYVVPDYGPYEKQPWPSPDKGYAAMIAQLDRDVGKLGQRLRELGLDNDTVMFFASDNGPALEGRHTPEFFRSSGGLRGHKGDLYEGGIRVPLIARWPGHFPAGKTCTHPVAFAGFLPTAADLAGIPAPEGLDQRSWKPLLEGTQGGPEELLYWETYGSTFNQAARLGKWKAVSLDSGRKLELYDLEADPGETTDLASQNPEIVERLRRQLTAAHSPSPLYKVKTKSKGASK